MEAPLWKATKTPGIISLCFSSFSLPPHLLLFFSCLCAGSVCSSRIHNAVEPQPSRGPWRARPGPLIRSALGCCEGHESTNITPLSKRTLGPTAERLCYCGSDAAGSEQIENAVHIAGLSQNPILDLVLQPILGTGSKLTLWLLFFGGCFKAIYKCSYERAF